MYFILYVTQMSIDGKNYIKKDIKLHKLTRQNLRRVEV